MPDPIFNGPGARVSAMLFQDPVTGETKDALGGGGFGTYQSGVPAISNQIQDATRNDVNDEVSHLWDHQRKTFIRPPKNDQEAAAMNAFMERLQSADHEAHRQRKNHLLQMLGFGAFSTPDSAQPNTTGGF